MVDNNVQEDSTKPKFKINYWFKLSQEFFQSKSIKKLLKNDKYHSVIIFYLQLSISTLATEGYYNFDKFEDTIEEELSLEFDYSPSKIKKYIETLAKLQLVTFSNGNLFLPIMAENIGKKDISTERVTRYRKRQQELRNGNETPCNGFSNGGETKSNAYRERDRSETDNVTVTEKEKSPHIPQSDTDCSTQSSTSGDIPPTPVPTLADSWLTITDEDIQLVNANLADKANKGLISKRHIEETISGLVANEVLIEGYYPHETVWRIITYVLRRQNPTKLKKPTCTSIDTPIKWKRFKNELLKCETGNLNNSLDVSIEKSYGTLIANEQQPDARCVAFKQNYQHELHLKTADPRDLPCTPEENEERLKKLRDTLSSIKQEGGSLHEEAHLNFLYDEFEADNSTQKEVYND